MDKTGPLFKVNLVGGEAWGACNPLSLAKFRHMLRYYKKYLGGVLFLSTCFHLVVIVNHATNHTYSDVCLILIGREL